MDVVSIRDLFISIEMVPYGSFSLSRNTSNYPTELFWSSEQISTMTVFFNTKDFVILLSLGAYKIHQHIRTGCSKRMIGVTFQTLYPPNPNTGADFVTGWRDVWPSKGETNTGTDRRGNTSGTFLDWGRGKIVPATQSLPNLHQVLGIKGSISDLAFCVWLNHPGQGASGHN